MTIILINSTLARLALGQTGSGQKREGNRTRLMIPFAALFFYLKVTMKTRWFFGALAFLSICLLPFAAFCQKASIKDVRVKGGNGAWEVSFFIESCFTERMEEAIQTGMPTIFTLSVQVSQKRKWWRDRKVASVEFRHTIQFDPIRGEYQVTLEEKEASLLTRHLAEAKAWMARGEEARIQPSSPLKPGLPAEIRIKAELDPVRLPLRLESLLFFVSLWDFETDWHIEPLPP